MKFKVRGKVHLSMVVTGEALAPNILRDDIWFLGGVERHRNVRGLEISYARGQRILIRGVDYRLNVKSGQVTFLKDQGRRKLKADYFYKPFEEIFERALREDEEWQMSQPMG